MLEPTRQLDGLERFNDATQDGERFFVDDPNYIVPDNRLHILVLHLQYLVFNFLDEDDIALFCSFFSVSFFFFF